MSPHVRNHQGLAPLTGSLSQDDILTGRMDRAFWGKGAATTLDIRVPLPLYGLAVLACDHPFLCPDHQLAINAFWPVPDTLGLGIAAPRDDPVMAPDDPIGGDVCQVRFRSGKTRQTYMMARRDVPTKRPLIIDFRMRRGPLRRLDECRKWHQNR